MFRAFLNALFILLFVRLVIGVARLLVGRRRDEEIAPGSSPRRGRQDGAAPGATGGARGRRRSRRVAPGDIVDVPYTEVPPPESAKRT